MDRPLEFDPMPADDRRKPRHLVLDDTLDLRAASDLARTLLSLRGTPLVVDPAKVGRIGGQCAQVLVSASNSWAADGIAFSVLPGSAAFDEGLRLLGLASTFTHERSQR